ncbi:hypothetical protein GCM10020001_016290 [Nonomuraea salmonea]
MAEGVSAPCHAAGSIPGSPEQPATRHPASTPPATRPYRRTVTHLSESLLKAAQTYQ